MTARRIALVLAGLAWLGMLGALGVIEHRKRALSQGASGYVESIFGANAPALVRKSIRLQELAGAEQTVGYIEVQTQLSGMYDAMVQTNLEISGRKIPPMISAALTQAIGPPEDFSGELHVYVGRIKGVTRIEGKGSYGTDRMGFSAVRFGEDQLKVTTRHGRERSPESYVPYDHRLPFTGDLSPIKAGSDLKLGDSWVVTHFNPLTRTSTQTLVRVEGEDTIRYRREDVKCWVLRAHPTSGAGSGPGGAGAFGISSSTAWVARKPGDKLDGQTLREEMQVLFFKVALVLDELMTREEINRDGASMPATPAKTTRKSEAAGR